jgi:hypothetical protein
MQNIRSKGKPFATGLLATLWATDPEGAQRVASACGAAQALSREAQRQAEAVQRSEALIRAIESNNGALKNLREFHEGRDKDRPGPLDGRVGYILVRIVEMTLARWQALLVEEEGLQRTRT